MLFDESKRSMRWPFLFVLAMGVFAGMASSFPIGLVYGQDSLGYQEVQAKFFAGDYEECTTLARAEVESGIWNDVWSRLLIQSLNATGEYEEATQVYELVAQKFAGSLPLRMLGAESYRYAGKHEQGDALIKQIPTLVDGAPWRFSDRDNALAIGKFLVDAGEDARVVLDGFYDRCLKLDPNFVEAHIAVAELALDKADYQEAVRALTRAVEIRPEDPQIHYLLSRAWSPSDSDKASEFLQKALELNPRHVNSLLVGARTLIDRESYDEAVSVLDEVLAVNKHEPRAWALKAAIAHLTGDYKLEGEHRREALASWSTNPQVDHLIGETLSHHYRFEESVAYQRRALKFEPAYMPARFQLAQDLLRLGATDEGWSIVDQVSQTDTYNVVAYNLKTLQKRLAEFDTLESPGLLVRMQTLEAKLYGPRALQLLEKARDELCKKYDVKLDEQIVVEIFPQQSDFAIRTFGLPGGDGYLGVCFGNLITANSPASQGESPSNWESVLWHEFCHVVTLNKTKNRMPRWLSEGISVYEELERDESWGQRMNPTYKKMILGEDFVPLSALSSAFLQPKSALHLQFAYFESSMAVRYLIDQHGMPRMLRLLDSLGLGLPIEQAFQQLYGDQVALDEDFERYAKGAAESFGKDVIFEQGELPEQATGTALQAVLDATPNHYLAWQLKALEAISQEKWDTALTAAQRLTELYPEDVSNEGGLALQALIARKLNNNELELSVLTQLVAYSSDEVSALLRLLELAKQAEDWTTLSNMADKLLSVQPLIAAGHEAQVLAGQRLGKHEDAVTGLRALLALDPIDTAGLRFELASSLTEANDLEAARIEVLQALEEAPRFRDAQRLLVTIRETLDGTDAESKQASPAEATSLLPSVTLEAALPDDALPPKP